VRKRDLADLGAPSARCAQRLSSFRLAETACLGSLTKVNRGCPRNHDVGSFQPTINSWERHLQARGGKLQRRLAFGVSARDWATPM